VFSIILPDKVAVASVQDAVPSGWQSIDCRPMIDGAGNSPELVEMIVSSGLEVLSNGVPVCFVCDYGHSRSNFVAAVVLSRLTGIDIYSAMNVVRDGHPESRIKDALSTDLGGIHISESNLQKNSPTWGITGSNGLIGTALSTQISGGGGDVVEFSRQLNGDFLQNSSTFCDLMRLHGVTDLIHLAYPTPYNSYDAMKLAFSQLVTVVEACLSAKVVLHFMSSWVVFDGSADSVVDEDSKTMAHSLYGQSKELQERFIEAQRQHQDLKSTVYRLPGLLSRSSLQPRFLRYFADCITLQTDMVTHRYRNGSATVPLANLRDVVADLAERIVNPDPKVTLIHVSGKAECLTVESIATELANAYGLTVSKFPVDRSTFTGEFRSKYSSFSQDIRVDSRQVGVAVKFVERLIK
jgi:nucleoside-diphosphate-sugar epimerase